MVCCCLSVAWYLLNYSMVPVQLGCLFLVDFTWLTLRIDCVLEADVTKLSMTKVTGIYGHLFIVLRIAILL